MQTRIDSTQQDKGAANIVSAKQDGGISLPAVPVLQSRILQQKKEGTQDNIQKFISDEGEEGKIGKTAFLSELKQRVSETADNVLAKINQTSADCPYIQKWFTHYAAQDPSQIEKAITRYAPASSGVDTIESYIAAIVERVKHGLENHIKTGSTEAIPPEILEQDHKPGDFLHIAEKPDSVAQLARLFGGGGGGVPAPAPAPVIRSHVVLQGQTAIAQAGDRIFNAGTTSCGLVIGFGGNGIACYHWPFLTDAPGYHATFQALCVQVAPLNRVEIITNDFPNAHQQADYIASATAIQAAAGVPTAYYVRDNQLIGDPWGTLAAAHLNSPDNLRQIF